MKGVVLFCLLCLVSAENVATVPSDSEPSDSQAVEKSATIEPSSDGSLEKSSSDRQSSPLLEISATERFLVEDNILPGARILSENSGSSSQPDLKSEEKSSEPEGTTSQPVVDETASSFSESSSSSKSVNEKASVDLNLPTTARDVSIEGKNPSSEIQISDSVVSKSMPSSSLSGPFESITTSIEAKPIQGLSFDKSQFSSGESPGEEALPTDNVTTETLKEEKSSVSMDSDPNKETLLTSGDSLAENAPIKSALPSPNYNISPQQHTGLGSEIKLSSTKKCITEVHSNLGISQTTSKVPNLSTSGSPTHLQQLGSIGSDASSIETPGVPSAAPIFIRDFSRAPGITPFYGETGEFASPYTVLSSLQSGAYPRNGLPDYSPLVSGSSFSSGSGLLPSPTYGGHLLRYPLQEVPTYYPPSGVPSTEGLTYNWHRGARPSPPIGDFTSGFYPNFPSQQYIL